MVIPEVCYLFWDKNVRTTSKSNKAQNALWFQWLVLQWTIRWSQFYFLHWVSQKMWKIMVISWLFSSLTVYSRTLNFIYFCGVNKSNNNSNSKNRSEFQTNFILSYACLYDVQSKDFTILLDHLYLWKINENLKLFLDWLSSLEPWKLNVF